jgi:hypothetical protein
MVGARGFAKLVLQNKRMGLTVKLLMAIAGCVLACHVAMAETCSQDAILKAANEVKASRQRLITTKLDDSMGMQLPPSLQKEISELKDALSATVSAYLQCAKSNTLDLVVLQSELLRMMAVQEHPPLTQFDKEQEDGFYGTELKINASHPVNAPHLIAITISFGIECGNDSILLIYEFHEGAWLQALRWQSGGYEAIKEAFGDFFEYFVLLQPSGKWLVAAAHGTPWCSSRFSAFAVDLIQPVRDNASQQTLQHQEYGYSRDEGVVPKLRPDGFELRMQVNSLDLDLLTRRDIYRFQLIGNRLERIQPIAINGRDFVDEWLQAPWSDAKRWSDAANLDSLAKEKTSFDLKNNSGRPMLSFGAVRSCSDDLKHFQVELDLHPGPTHYFQIKQGDNSFTMLSAATQPNASCKGADLMPKR